MHVFDQQRAQTGRCEEKRMNWRIMLNWCGPRENATETSVELVRGWEMPRSCHVLLRLADVVCHVESYFGKDFRASG